MRGVVVGLGCLLLMGGVLLVVIADQQRVDALDEARAAVDTARVDLKAMRDANYLIAEQLTDTRSHIAAQERELADATGFLP